jgi:hypothetical protein
MKRAKWLLAGMAALTLTFGLVLAGCPTGTEEDDPPVVDSRGAGLYDGASTTPVGGITDFNLANAFEWIKEHAEDNKNYHIVLGADETQGAMTLDRGRVNNANGVTITLAGSGEARTIQLDGTGHLYRIENGVTLALGKGITLKGVDANTDRLVRVEGGALTMGEGAVITGNTGGGVGVDNSVFTMSGGSITGNTGSGVSLDNGASFTMSAGSISGNTQKGTVTSGVKAGGVGVGNSTFIMSGGSISGNTVENTNGFAGGSGVYVDTWGENPRSVFTMSGGSITGNTVKSNNTAIGAVNLENSTFVMSGGVISGNRAEVTDPGRTCTGVSVGGNNSFKISGGAVVADDVNLWNSGIEFPAITIAGPLTGSGRIMTIDLNSSSADANSVGTEWNGKPILKWDDAYTGHPAAFPTERFALGIWFSGSASTAITGKSINAASGVLE